MKKNLFVTLLLLTYSYSFAQVQWQDDGVPVRQGENIVWNQTSVACDDGSFVSVWTDTRNGVRGVYAQKVDGNGNSLWGENGLGIYNPDRMQSNPIAISSTNNSVIVCWQYHDAVEYYSSQIRAQKIDINGDLLWGEEGILLEESGPNNYAAQMIQHNDGGVYILWKTQSTLKGIRLLADGSIAGGWGQGIDLPAYFFDVHSDGLNGIIISSSLYDDIYLQRIDENGSKLWGYYGTLLFNGEEYIREIKVCSTITDEYYISWRTGSPYDLGQIKIQKADFTGNPIWESPIFITEDLASRLYTVCPSDSQPIVTWVINETIFSQKIDSDGNLLWGEEGITVFESNYDLNKNSVILKDDLADGCLISWVDYDNSYDESRIIVQKINEDGDLIFEEDGLIVYESYEYNYYNLYSSLAINNQNYYLCWLDNTDDSQSLIQQIVDEEGNIYLEENGEEMYFGLSGFASDIQLLSNGDNPIMLWEDTRNRHNTQIFLQILNDNGSNIFAENGIPITSNTQSDQEDLDAVFGENSETIAAVWLENREGYEQIFAQGIDTSGNYLWSNSSGIALSSSDTWSENPIMSVIDNSGTDEYYIGWEDWSDFMNPEIYGQRIINGEKQWSENGIQIATNEDYLLEIIDVIDRFYIWEEFYWPNSYLKVKLVDEDGNTAPGWQENGLDIICNSSNIIDFKFELIPSGLFISWLNNEDNNIYGQIVTPEGNILWQEGGIPLIEGDYINNFNAHYNDALYIVWNEYVGENHFNYYIQKFNEDGEPLWQDGGVRLSYWTQYTHSDPVIASVEQDVLVVWEHYFINQTTHIIAQLVSPDGELQYGLSGITICDQIMEQNYPQVYVNNNDAYICWRDGRSTIMGEEGLMSIPGVYAQKIHIEQTSADDELVKPIEILSNFPNPFNPETTISFSVTQNSDFVTIKVFNIKGQKIKQLEISNLKLGINEVIWDGKNNDNQPVASGIYFYQLNVDDKVIASKKCLLLK